MVDETIQTDVDKLLQLLEQKGEMSLIDAAKSLNVPLKTIQAWVDFLVEEKIIGVEYKFTSSHIYLNKGENTLTKKKKEEFNLNMKYFYDNFVRRARENKIPESKIHSLWENHLINKLDLVKSFFYDEAKKRTIVDIDTLWDEYKEEVMLH
jgi:hypothetical protein